MYNPASRHQSCSMSQKNKNTSQCLYIYTRLLLFNFHQPTFIIRSFISILYFRQYLSTWSLLNKYFTQTTYSNKLLWKWNYIVGCKLILTNSLVLFADNVEVLSITLRLIKTYRLNAKDSCFFLEMFPVYNTETQLS